MLLNTKLLTLLVLADLALTTVGADFSEIIRNPEKFDKKRVTLVAMARVGGDRFYLYQPPEPELPRDDARVIYGQLLPEGPYYKQFDHKLVRVTGVVDSDYRGLTDTNACSLIIERVRPARRVEKPKVSYGDGPCLEVNFSQLLKDPKSYERKCICVTGLAHVRGDAFVIYESEKAAGGGYSARTKAIFVSPASDTADYDRYNKRWVKVTGTVDMNQRGFADLPCGIIAERVELAPSKK
ncbi:MAG: hypothetical protein ACRD3W_22480 [Terriglobales bacterium]